MNAIQIVLSLALVASVSAIPGEPGIYAQDYYAYPKYSYSYGVKDALTGDAKSAHETRDGGVVKGSYSLVQPDGVLRTVNYVADPIHGFQAQVINSAPGVHAVGIKKAIVPAVVPAIGHHHGHYGHAVAAVAKPLAIGHAHHHAGYGHGGYGLHGGLHHGHGLGGHHGGHGGYHHGAGGYHGGYLGGYHGGLGHY